MRTTLGIPTVGNIVPALPGHLSAAVELGRLGEVVISCPNNALPHDRAREAVLDDAIASDADFLLFLDADTLMPAGGAGKLFSAMKATGAQVVSGHYYQRGYPYACIWARLDDGVSRHVDARTGNHPIHGCGMGCCLIDLRWCREHLVRPFFRIVDTPGQPRLWEDFYFCKLVHEQGGLVIGAADVRCAHLGNPECVDDNSADLLRRLWLERDRLEGDTNGSD